MKYILFLFICLKVQTALALTWSGQTHIWNSHRLLGPGQTEAYLSIQSQSSDVALSPSGKKTNIGEQALQKKSLDSGSAYRSYQVKLSQMRFTPMWSYGLTRNWTIAARLPIVRMSAQIQQSIRSSGEIRDDLAPSFAAKGKSAHYFDLSSNEDRTRIGRVEIRSKHAIESFRKFNMVIYETLKLPTAESEDLDYLIYSELPAQSFAAGIGSTLRGHIYKGLSVNWASEYTSYMSDEIYAKKEDGFLTDEKYNRSPGHEIITDLAGSLRSSTKPLLLSLGYRYQYQAESTYDDKNEDFAESFSQKKSSMYMAVAWAKPKPRSYFDSSSNLRAQIEWESTISGSNIMDADTLSLGISSQF